MIAIADRQRLIEALRDVEDPELPISILDMGLFVDLREASGQVQVDITLTSMGCPGVDMITDGIHDRLLMEDGVESVIVNIVWDPIWSKDRLTAEGKAQLREWGISL